MNFEGALDVAEKVTLRKVDVTQFMGIGQFDYQFKVPVTVVMGQNATGKSSLAAAIRGGLASEPDPLGVGPRRMKLYGHKGGNAAVSVHLVDGSTRVWSPTMGKFTGSAAYTQNQITVGLRRPFELRTDKEINEFWDSIVKVRLGKEAILEKCRDIVSSFPEIMRESVWNFLVNYSDKNIPDECDRDKLRDLHARFKVQRSQTMGSIQALCKVDSNVKGENIMSKAEFDILPEDQHWTVKTIDVAVTEMERDLKGYYVDEGVQEKLAQQQAELRTDTADELAAKKDEMSKAKDTYDIRNKAWEDQIDGLDKFIVSAMSQIEEIRAKEKLQRLVMKCPSCDVDLTYDTEHHVLVRPEEGHRFDEKKRTDAMADWEKKKQQAEKDRFGILEQKKRESEDLTLLRRQVAVLEKRLETIDKTIKDREQTVSQAHAEGRKPISPGEYDVRMTKIWHLKELRINVEKRDKVRKYAYRMQAEDILIKLLDPGGLVASQRDRGFAMLTHGIREIEAHAQSKFKPVRIDGDGRITIGESTHAMASKSERVWTNWVIQAAFAALYAKRRPRPVMVLDELDIFDSSEIQAVGRTVSMLLTATHTAGGSSQFILLGTGIGRHAQQWNIEHGVDVVSM